jgi:hypothetical protein
MMTLPKQVIVSTRQDPRLMLIYGPPKIGKTTILSKLKGNLIIDTENGTEFVDALKVPVKDMAEYTQACTLLKNEGKNAYPYVSLDTVDKIEDWSDQAGTEMYKKSLQGKGFTGASVLNLPMGAGYLWLRQAFDIYLHKIMGTARTVILVGHIRDKMIESAGKEVNAKDLDLTGKIKSILCSKADAIGFINRDVKGNLYITFETKDTINCGSRCPHLKGQTFTFDKDPNSFDWTKIFVDGNKPENQTAGLLAV